MTNLIALMRKMLNKHEDKRIHTARSQQQLKRYLEKSQNENETNDFRIDFP